MLKTSRLALDVDVDPRHTQEASTILRSSQSVPAHGNDPVTVLRRCRLKLKRNRGLIDTTVAATVTPPKIGDIPGEIRRISRHPSSLSSAIARALTQNLVYEIPPMLLGKEPACRVGGNRLAL